MQPTDRPGQWKDRVALAAVVKLIPSGPCRVELAVKVDAFEGQDLLRLFSSFPCPPAASGIPWATGHHPVSAFFSGCLPVHTSAPTCALRETPGLLD